MLKQKNLKFKVIASVKVASDEPKAWAGVWSSLEDTKDGENSFFLTICMTDKLRQMGSSLYSVETDRILNH
jgi:hypothetical protein